MALLSLDGTVITNADNSPRRKGNAAVNANEIVLQITADNVDGRPAISEFFLFAGVGKATAKALPVGVALTGGDFETWADFQEYMRHVPVEISEIRFQSADAANFSNRMVYADRAPNLRSPRESFIELSKYKETGGGVVADVLTVPSRALPNGSLIMVPQSYLKAQIKKNTVMNITLSYKAYTQQAELDPAL